MARRTEAGEQGQGTAAEGSLVLVLTTEANLDQAEKLALALLDRGLVACVSLMPIVSLYRWEGHTRRDQEVQLLLKTHPSCLQTLHDTVLELHSYDIPEWITLTGQTRGGYAHWCAEQLVVAGPPSGQMVGHQLDQ